MAKAYSTADTTEGGGGWGGQRWLVNICCEPLPQGCEGLKCLIQKPLINHTLVVDMHTPVTMMLFVC